MGKYLLLSIDGSCLIESGPPCIKLSVKTFGRTEVMLWAVYASPMNESEWSISRSGQFIPREIVNRCSMHMQELNFPFSVHRHPVIEAVVSHWWHSRNYRRLRIIVHTWENRVQGGEVGTSHEGVIGPQVWMGKTFSKYEEWKTIFTPIAQLTKHFAMKTFGEVELFGLRLYSTEALLGTDSLSKESLQMPKSFKV
jgi:hypothetical protein